MANSSVNPKKERISRPQLITLYEAFKTHREKIGLQCHNRLEVMRLLHGETGIPVSQNTFEDILDILGLKLTDVITLKRSKNKTPGSGAGSVTRADIRTITQELAHIIRELGYQPNDSFIELYERLLTRPFITPAATVPVASVPDPKTIPLVK